MFTEEFAVDRWENVLYTFSLSCSPQGVKFMTMISMEQEAVPAAFPTTYRQILGATRYRRAGTMTGWLNRKHRLFGRHFGSTGTGVVAATAWEAHVLAPSPIARSAHLREAAPLQGRAP